MIKSLTLRQSWLLPATLFIVAGLPAKTLILPVEAIVDSGQLSAEDFEKNTLALISLDRCPMRKDGMCAIPMKTCAITLGH